MTCELCAQAGGELIHRAPHWRVVRAHDAAHPAFYRVIWNAHVGELSDLDDAHRAECLAAVVAVERVLRDLLRPIKINVASLGNMVPHLHWHVIARFDWDSHFPQPVWGTPQRAVDGVRQQALIDLLPDVDFRLRGVLEAAPYTAA